MRRRIFAFAKIVARFSFISYYISELLFTRRQPDTCRAFFGMRKVFLSPASLDIDFIEYLLFIPASVGQPYFDNLYNYRRAFSADIQKSSTFNPCVDAPIDSPAIIVWLYILFAENFAF